MTKNRDKCIGAYLGAAIGDAMGGPVENNHFRRIRRLVGEVTGLLPYTAPTVLPKIGPGYALQTDAGSVTDDTFIRADFTGWLIQNPPPRTPESLVRWMMANADFEKWWKPLIEAMKQVADGECTPQEAGRRNFQGGGIGWWTPFGIVHAGDPGKAAAVTRELCCIWKDELEQDFCAAVVSGIAVAVSDDATVTSVIAAMMAQCGPLATALMTRALEIANNASDIYDLAEKLYRIALMPELEKRHEHEPPRARDTAMPPVWKPVVDTDVKYMSSFYAEQIPFSAASFVFAQGDPRKAIPAACMLGRDADTLATTVGAWAGGLHGESGLPLKWIDTVCEANRKDLDLRDLAEKIVDIPE